MVSQSVVVFLALLAAAYATDVRKCSDSSLDKTTDVQLSSCEKLPCKLKRGTTQHITIKFTPENEIADLKNVVHAPIMGVNLPFPGVDGVSICDKLFTDSGEKASCPLAAGANYTYKDHFPIYYFYPNIKTTVHWKLQDEKIKDIVCFDVNVQIK